MDTGYAYFAGGNVYFDTSRLEHYYVFNDHDEDDLAVGVREGVEEDTNKRNKTISFSGLPNQNSRTRRSMGLSMGRRLSGMAH